MKRFIYILLIIFAVFLCFACDGQFTTGCDEQTGDNDQQDATDAPALLEGVQHFKQATIRIERDLVIYFDPYQFQQELNDADVIFITHSHIDHFSAADLAKVAKDDTLIVAPLSMEQRVLELGYSNLKTVEPGMQYSAGGLEFETTFAYSPGTMVRHPKSNNWVGYIVTIDAKRYYIAGDTQLVPEIESLEADVAFLPVGGGSSMNAEEAAQAAGSIGPQIAVPIHYGVTAGDLDDAKYFVELLEIESIDGVIYSDAGELMQ